MPRGDAQQKARQRARNKEAGQPGTRGGSSGVSLTASKLERVEFEDIMHLAEHVVDITALFQSGQLMANRSVSGVIVAPKEFAHDMTEVSLQSQGQALFVRFYVVPMDAVLPDLDDEEDD